MVLCIQQIKLKQTEFEKCFVNSNSSGKEVFIITVEQIKNKIYNQLMKQDEHIILEHMPDEYFNLFWKSISILHEGEILTSSKV